MERAAAVSLRRCWRTPRSVQNLRCHGPGVSVRGIRTGFFPEDEDYIDPEGPLLADRINARWRYMDDASLGSTVLERSNVGMGMLVLNRENGLDLPTINDAYVRLRNLEVNSFKRFVGLTATEPGPFCAGLDKMELLLVATCARFHNFFPPFGRALLWHNQELAHLVANYRKPVVCHVNGTAANSGAALACLASHCGVHEKSEMVVDACRVGLVPDGGMTHILGNLQWFLGEFLALTGWALRGADLVYCGLARHWLAPEALPFLELTAEKHLEVSEADARALLDEHSLPLPEGMRDGDSLPRRLVPLISEIFSKRSVEEIKKELKNQAKENDPTNKLKAVRKELEAVRDSFKERSKREDITGALGVRGIPIPSNFARDEVKERLENVVIDQVLTEVWGDLERAVVPILKKMQRILQPIEEIPEASIRQVSENIGQLIQEVKLRHGKLISRRQEEAKQAAKEAVQEASDIGELDAVNKYIEHMHEEVRNVSSKKLKEVLSGIDNEAFIKDDSINKIFVEICQQRMDQASPLALRATLKLIREARNREIRSKQKDPKMHPIALMESLEMEMRVFQRLLSTEDAVLGLHARCMGKQHTNWSQVQRSDDDISDLMSPLNPDLAICPRPDMSLSQHPRLRRYHPNFNPKTGLDHDPVWMAAEATRWSKDFLAKSREVAVRELLDGSDSKNKDPASCGLSRFTRVQ